MRETLDICFLSYIIYFPSARPFGFDMLDGSTRLSPSLFQYVSSGCFKLKLHGYIDIYWARDSTTPKPDATDVLQRKLKISSFIVVERCAVTNGTMQKSVLNPYVLNGSFFIRLYTLPPKWLHKALDCWNNFYDSIMSRRDETWNWCVAIVTA